MLLGSAAIGRIAFFYALGQIPPAVKYHVRATNI